MRVCVCEREREREREREEGNNNIEILQYYTFQATPVSFSVQPVPDSLQQQGSFKNFHERGTLKTLINVEPTDAIEITGQGLELQFPLPDGMPVL
jgi:hypothetical protein